jgi:hypothetical protein
LYTNVPGDSKIAQEDSGTAVGSPFALEDLRDAVAAARDDHRERASEGYPPVPWAD